MQNAPRDRHGELHRIVLGFHPQPMTLPRKVPDHSLEGRQYGSLAARRALFGGLLRLRAALLTGGGHAGLGLALNFAFDFSLLLGFLRVAAGSSRIAAAGA